MYDRHNLIAYLATLAAIVVLTVAGAIVCVQLDTDTHLAQIVGALGFISAATVGLVGVIGTFKARQDGASEKTVEDLTKKIPPVEETEA